MRIDSSSIIVCESAALTRVHSILFYYHPLFHSQWHHKFPQFITSTHAVFFSPSLFFSAPISHFFVHILFFVSFSHLMFFFQIFFFSFSHFFYPPFFTYLLFIYFFVLLPSYLPTFHFCFPFFFYFHSFLFFSFFHPILLTLIFTSLPLPFFPPTNQSTFIYSPNHTYSSNRSLTPTHQHPPSNTHPSTPTHQHPPSNTHPLTPIHQHPPINTHPATPTQQHPSIKTHSSTPTHPLRFPVKEWLHLGTFNVSNERAIQKFHVPFCHIFAKYIRIDVLSHYGTEHYCPISILRSLPSHPLFLDFYFFFFSFFFPFFFILFLFFHFYFFCLLK